MPVRASLCVARRAVGQDPSPPPPPRSGEGEQNGNNRSALPSLRSGELTLSFSPSPLRGGGRGEGLWLIVLGWLVLLPAGCGRQTAAEPEKDPPTAQKRVTLHVKDMAERLDLA